MRYYGKYEKRPEAPAKQPKAKNMMLQTYFTSLLCLVLCVTMFFGTSYAWFTSEVSNTANEIYVGTLNVGLYKGEAKPENSLANSDTKLFDGNIRWEPGFTALETIKIVNEGDLAFSYVLKFTDGGLASGSTLELADVAKYFDVWVFDHTANEGKEGVNSAPESYAEIKAENSGWVRAGADEKNLEPTLTDLLNGKTVLDGDMTAVRDSDAATPINEGTTDGVATAHTYTIALHMNETADDAVMGQKISLNVKLVAYQKGYEEDDLGNNNYDLLVATESGLREALQNGGQVTLLENIVLTEGMSIPNGVTVNLDLNGHTISTTTDVAMSLITNNGTLNVNDSIGTGEISVTFNGNASTNAAVNAINNRGTMTVNGGKISNTNKAGQIGYAIDNYNGAKLTVNGGTIEATGDTSDGIRLFCGNYETVVTVNDGKISTIWAQNPSADEAAEVRGTVILNGGTVTTVYYENYTTVKVAEGVTAKLEAYGAGKDSTETTEEDNYSVYSFKHGS